MVIEKDMIGSLLGSSRPPYFFSCHVHVRKPFDGYYSV